MFGFSLSTTTHISLQLVSFIHVHVCIRVCLYVYADAERLERVGQMVDDIVSVPASELELTRLSDLFETLQTDYAEV